MRKIKKVVPKLFLIFIFSFLFINARIMNLDQDAKTLDNGESETNFNTGEGLVLYLTNYSTSINPDLLILWNYCFQQRVGVINDVLELQMRINNLLLLIAVPSGGAGFFNNVNFNDFGMKFRLLTNEKYNISITPGFGIYYGYSLLGLGYNNIYIGTIANLQFISSFYINESLSLYFGLSSQLRKNLLNYMWFGFSLFELNNGISIGWEKTKSQENTKNKYKFRNEIILSSYINFARYSAESIQVFQFAISLAYSFSFGKSYYSKKISL